MSCGNHESVVGPISWRGNCEACGMERLTQSVMELHNKRGPMYRRWITNLTAAMEHERLDATNTAP